MSGLYVGRLLLVGASVDGGVVAAYRLASRSFPHRRIHFDAEMRTAWVVPLPGHGEEAGRNPLLSYPCLRILDEASALVANGDHLTRIRERMEDGLPPMRCIAQVLAELGPEEDAYGTPRIVGLANPQGLVLGIVSKNGLMVQCFPLRLGLAHYLTTYGKTELSKNVLKNFNVGSAQEAAELIYKKGVFKGFSYA
ncbi:MAG: IMP cyclohydrolase, partial [Candidatus Bathyarchaeia archaeon]